MCKSVNNVYSKRQSKLPLTLLASSSVRKMTDKSKKVLAILRENTATLDDLLTLVIIKEELCCGFKQG
jgi:hypothetical protein